jgi:quinol monooxygenase YgiN
MFNMQSGSMTDQQNQARAMRPTHVATHHDDAKARIDSWWRLPTAAEADKAARGALEAMPWSAGLIRFSVLRSPAEPTLFLQSLWTTAAARDHYVHHVAPIPRAAIDDRVPAIERDRSLTEIVAVVAHVDTVAEKWTTRRLPATDEAGVQALLKQHTARLRGEETQGLVRATLGVGRDEDGNPIEVIVIEEWSDSTHSDVPAYEPFGAITPTI